MKLRRKSCLGFLILVLVLVRALGFAADSREPKRGGTLRFGVRRNLDTFNPFMRILSVNHRIRSLQYENLLAVDRDLNLIPALASSWTIAPDGLTYTFSLRLGAILFTL